MTEDSRAGDRLINTRFIKTLVNLTNRALLLYHQLIVWADSMGAIGETEIIITLLQHKADNEGDMGMGLIKTDYHSALDELIEKGLVYEVQLTSGNKVHIIKHWWLHNKWKKYLKSNYFKAINQFYIEAGEYRPKNERKKKNQKEEKEEQITKTKTTCSSNEELTSHKECVGTHEEPLCNIEKEDLRVGALGYDESKPHEKYFIKNGKPIKKLDNEALKVVKEAFNLRLDTFGESYYLTMLDEGLGKIKEAEVGKAIQHKIERDKRNAFIVKIISSLVISIVWSALTIRDFLSEGDEATKKAWLNLLSRLSALVTSFVSGYSTAVVNVRDEANAIENKANILKTFKTSYDKQFFIAETYEEMVARELKEQEEASKENDTEKLAEMSLQEVCEALK